MEPLHVTGRCDAQTNGWLSGEAFEFDRILNRARKLCGSQYRLYFTGGINSLDKEEPWFALRIDERLLLVGDDYVDLTRSRAVRINYLALADGQSTRQILRKNVAESLLRVRSFVARMPK